MPPFGRFGGPGSAECAVETIGAGALSCISHSREVVVTAKPETEQSDEDQLAELPQAKFPASTVHEP
jgi:hypothetical protein